jgi:hypothetical protein
VRDSMLVDLYENMLLHAPIVDFLRYQTSTVTPYHQQTCKVNCFPIEYHYVPVIAYITSADLKRLLGMDSVLDNREVILHNGSSCHFTICSLLVDASYMECTTVSMILVYH